ncbi:MAG: chemotaxis protein CheW [Spirochaetes bacterium]|nr:chemotaxis protein CheW [Spirochaetota bacterium]
MESILKSEKDIQLIIFDINHVEYGISIDHVVEIVKLQPVIALPQGPSFIKGVINLRGKVIPIMDLRERFNVVSIRNTRQTGILIIDIEGKEVGLIVDRVIDVRVMALDNIKPTLPVMDGIKMQYVKGIAKYNDKLVIILNIQNVLSSEEKIFLQDTTIYEKPSG